MWVVRVPDPGVLHFHYILGDYWPQEAPYSWMGRQINVVTHDQPMQLRISGLDRPSELGPVEIRVVNGSEVSRYRIAKQDTQLLNLPTGASITDGERYVRARASPSQWRRAASIGVDRPAARCRIGPTEIKSTQSDRCRTLSYHHKGCTSIV